MFTNGVVVNRFVEGYIKGRSHSMFLDGNKLYSYSCCIAVRQGMGGADGYKFIISNKAKFLGGRPYSITTTNHISLVRWACRNKEAMLVDGWAEEGKTEFFVPHFPTHKTVWGLIRSFSGYHRYEGWTGRWHADTGTREVEWLFENNRLHAPDGALVAKREYILMGGKQNSCNKKCDICPARFMCLTDGDGFCGRVFFIAKGKYQDLAQKYLSPAVVLDSIPDGNIIRLDS